MPCETLERPVVIAARPPDACPRRQGEPELSERAAECHWVVGGKELPPDLSPLVDGAYRPVEVLLIEDDEDEYVLCRHLLATRARGRYTLHWASTAAGALEGLASSRYDVCLLDHRLGDQDGLEILKEANQRGCRTPVIFMTGSGSGGLDVQALQAGAADYLDKEMADTSQLERVIRHAILRWEVRETLCKREECLRLAIRATNQAAWTWEIPSDRLTWFDAGEPRFGYLASEVGPGRDWWTERLHPEDRSRVLCGVQAILAGGEDYWSDEHRLRRKDGTYATVIAQARVVRDAAGQPVRMNGATFDVTDRRHLEEQLFQAQKMEAVGRLAGGVAHDFNNMLGAITGYADMLMQRSQLDDRARGCVEEILKASERATTLTRQLLTFSRKNAISLQPVDLNALAADLYPMLRTLIGEGIECVVVPDPAGAVVRADPGQMEQVLLNLAINARDAMPEGGKLTISCRRVRLKAGDPCLTELLRPGEYGVLSLTDTGCGMDEETKARIFEPFFSTKPKGKGTGLGLATVFGIVQQSRGQISVETTPGRGSTFRVYLPAETPPTAPEAGGVGAGPVLEKAPARADAATPPASGTVLVVEDEPIVRGMVIQVLRLHGYQVLEAVQGDDALRLCEQPAPSIDLLLTDLMMPGMSGPELAERAAPWQPQMKVLFMSGYTQEHAMRTGSGIHDRAFIQKPFKPGDLAHKVQELLRRSV